MHLRYLPEKTADIWRCHHWFPREKATEKHAQKFHTDDASLPDLGSDTSSVWNFCARSWDVISRKNQSWRWTNSLPRLFWTSERRMSAVFPSHRRTNSHNQRPKNKNLSMCRAEDSNCWTLMTFALCNQINCIKLQNLLIWLVIFIHSVITFVLNWHTSYYWQNIKFQ